jgi:hypothetical protein
VPTLFNRAWRAVPLAVLAAPLLTIGLGGCGTDKPQATSPQVACNGSVAACERRLDQVTFPATHNSFAASDEPGWHFANQRYRIARQLRDGIRGLLIDIHWGERDPASGVVRTDLKAEGSSRNKVAQALPAPALRLAERLAGRAGLGATTGRPSLYLCHTLCELGAEPVDAELRTIRRFLDAHRGEVLILVVEPYVPVAAIEDALRDTNLLTHAAQLRRDRPLPTLGDLVRADTRLVILAEEDGGTRPWYLPAFSFVQDTPYSARSVDELSCKRYRGKADSPLLLVNHWIARFPPSPRRNASIGGEVLRERVTRCERERGLRSNLIAVDFYERSGVVKIADELNARG